MTDNTFLTTEEIATRLQVTTKTVRELIERGEIVAYRIGRAWRISEKDFYTYLENQKSNRKGENE